MAEKKRFGMTLSMSDPLQRQAWEILSAVPERQRTAAVCKALCRADGDRILLDEVRAVVQDSIRAELRDVQFITASENNTGGETEKRSPQDREIQLDAATMDYLFSLSTPGGFDFEDEPEQG